VDGRQRVLHQLDHVNQLSRLDPNHPLRVGHELPVLAELLIHNLVVPVMLRETLALLLTLLHLVLKVVDQSRALFYSEHALVDLLGVAVEPAW